MSQELRRKLKEIDHRGYPAYKSLRGRYRFADYMLNIEHVQGDPFAAPSALSITITAEEAGFPKDLLTDPSNPLTHRNSIALADELLRRFASGLRRGSHQTKGSGKSGSLSCAVPGQEVLERSACFFNGKGDLTVKFLVGFPAAGRTILAGELVKILFSILPKCVSENLLYSSLPAGRLAAVRNLADANGMWADFSPKPIRSQPGNGMHLNMSVSSKDGRDFSSAFMAGILKYIKDITLFLNPLPQSYERFGQMEAPYYISWSGQNRSQLIRIPADLSGRKRMELRSPDPMANPYLAYTLLIYAGLEGISQNLRPDLPMNVNLYTADPDLTGKLDKLPSKIEEAMQLARGSEFVAQHVSKELLDAYCDVSRIR